ELRIAAGELAVAHDRADDARDAVDGLGRRAARGARVAAGLTGVAVVGRRVVAVGVGRAEVVADLVPDHRGVARQVVDLEHLAEAVAGALAAETRDPGDARSRVGRALLAREHHGDGAGDAAVVALPVGAE